MSGKSFYPSILRTRLNFWPLRITSTQTKTFKLCMNTIFMSQTPNYWIFTVGSSDDHLKQNKNVKNFGTMKCKKQFLNFSLETLNTIYHFCPWLFSFKFRLSRKKSSWFDVRKRESIKCRREENSAIFPLVFHTVKSSKHEFLMLLRYYTFHLSQFAKTNCVQTSIHATPMTARRSSGRKHMMKT